MYEELVLMFESFRDIQKLEVRNGAELLREANLSFRFLGKGMELQLLRAGGRELSVLSNSVPFIHSLRSKGELEVALGFGSIAMGEQSVRVGIGGKFQSLSADEDVNQVVMPAVTIPTLAIFIERPFSSDKTLIGLQFMEAIPMREISIEMENPREFDKSAFKAFCHRQLRIPETPQF